MDTESLDTFFQNKAQAYCLMEDYNVNTMSASFDAFVIVELEWTSLLEVTQVSCKSVLFEVTNYVKVCYGMTLEVNNNGRKATQFG
jgi:hypothetical protein